MKKRDGKYTGLSRARRKRRAGVAIAAAVMLLLAVSVFLILERYAVFTPSGMEFDFGAYRTQGQGDGGQNTDGSTSVPSGAGFPIVRIPAPKEEVSVDIDGLPPEPKPSDGVDAFYIDLKMLESSDADELTALFEDSGKNAVLVDIKSADGRLSFKTDNKIALKCGASAQGDRFTQLISRLREKRVYVIGRMWCFRDNLAPRYTRTIAIKASETSLFLDEGYSTWLNPFSKEARGYLCEIAKKAYALGVDEIQLEDGGFPENDEKAVYGDTADTKEDALAEFAAELEKIRK